jgi:hypothetical protein
MNLMNADEPLFPTHRPRPHSWFMKGAGNQEQQVSKADQWRDRIARTEARQSLGAAILPRAWTYGTSLLRLAETVAWPRTGRFAPSGSRWAQAVSAAEANLELVLPRGERLRTGSGVDGATPRTVLDALRA